jgi:hypothetical protein
MPVVRCVDRMLSTVFPSFAMSFSRALDDLPLPQKSPAERFREALEMYDEGVALQRQNFVRRHPNASPGEIDVMLQGWLQREDEA